MPLQKYIFKPGIDREGTDYSNEGGWFDANLIRFRKGRPEKIGGWIKASSSTYLGIARALHAWIDLAGTRYLGLGTSKKYYVELGSVFHDITPIRATTTNGITFSATNGSSTITATDSSHGAVAGDFVTISGAVSLGGLVTAAVLNQEYEIATIPSVNTYTFTAKDTSGTTVTANASDSGNGGAGVDGAYQINIGLDNYVQGTGWGLDTWGASTFGSTSSLDVTNQLRLWTHDNFGEDLVLNPRLGGIYYWDESGGTTARAVALPDVSGANLAPTKALQVLTLRISSGSQIVGGLTSREEVLIWTDSSLYAMQFIGPPYTFSVNLINHGLGLIGPKAAVNTPNGIFWMDRKGFYKYSGQLELVPCSVHSYIFEDINDDQSYKVFGFLNKQFNEVGWFYPSSSNLEIDRYAVYNYAEATWSIGQLSRYAWLDEGVISSPRATGTASSSEYLYLHESGNDADGSPMEDVYIESSDLDLEDGEAYTFIRRVIPDVRFTGSGGSDQTINFVLKSRNFPGDSLTTDTTQTVTSSTQKLDTRIRARQLTFRIESDDDNASLNARSGVGWRLGDTRFDVKPDGRR